MTLYHVSDMTFEGVSPNQKAFWGAVAAFILFGCINLPNTLMIRPHPIFWRFLLSLLILYSFGMTYIFMLPLD